MADLKIAIEIAAQDNASGVFGKVGGAVGGLVKGLGAIGLAAQGMSVIGSAVEGLIGPFAEAQAVAAQTDAVLQSTGHAAGVFAADVEGLSKSLASVTPFEDELISKTQNMLLTFTNVGNDVFPQATESALNMAQALGEDPVQAAMRLGKALNDPIQGVTALRRVGVQLSDAQEAQVKSFMAVGDVASAQKIILQELETEFGNSARAAGETFAGKLAIAQNKLGDLKEIIGGPVVGALTFLLDKAIPLAEMMGEVLPEAIGFLSEKLTPVADFIQNEVGPRLESLGTIAKAAITGDFAGALDGLKDLLVSDVGPGVQQGLQGIGEGVVTWIVEQAPIIGQKLVGEWLPAFIEWYTTELIPGALERLGNLVTGIAGFIKQHGPGFAETLLAEWVPNFIGWILGTALPEMVKLLAQLVAGVGTWLVTEGGPAIGEAAIELGAAIVRGIIRGIGNLAGQVGSALTRMLGDAFDAGKRFIGAQSPSKKAEKELGEPVPQGIAKGILNARSVVVDALGTTARLLFDDSKGDFVSAGMALGKEIAKGVAAGGPKGFADIGGAPLGWVKGGPTGWMVGGTPVSADVLKRMGISGTPGAMPGMAANGAVGMAGVAPYGLMTPKPEALAAVYAELERIGTRDPRNAHLGLWHVPGPRGPGSGAMLGGFELQGIAMWEMSVAKWVEAQDKFAQWSRGTGWNFAQIDPSGPQTRLMQEMFFRFMKEAGAKFPEGHPGNKIETNVILQVDRQTIASVVIDAISGDVRNAAALGAGMA